MRALSRSTLAVAAVLAATVCSSWVTSPVASAGAGTNRVMASAPTLTTLTNQVVPNLGSYTDLGPVGRDQQVLAAIALQHDNAAIQAVEAELYDPTSSSYHQWLTP